MVGYQSRQIRPLIGYVPDYFGAYEDMAVQEYLEFFAAAYNINGPTRTKIVNDVLELTDLGYKRDALVDGLSRRHETAPVHRPRPGTRSQAVAAGRTGGKSRPGPHRNAELLKELRRMGKTILISSHILPELQDLCNIVGIIEHGELIYSGPWTDIIKKAKIGTVLHVGVAPHQQVQAGALLSKNPDIENVATVNGHLEVSIRDGIADYSFVPRSLIEAGFQLILLKEEECNLETAFMRLTKGMVQ